jgi:hypothetical protein
MEKYITKSLKTKDQNRKRIRKIWNFEAEFSLAVLIFFFCIPNPIVARFAVSLWAMSAEKEATGTQFCYRDTIQIPQGLQGRCLM